MIQQKMLGLLLFLAPALVNAQETTNPRVSPVAIASAHYKDTYLKVVYGQPQKKGRVIFGNVVPYGQVWRTGANESTEFTFTKDITINATVVPAGTYSLFTIPEPEKWTIILNRDLGMWGSYQYNSKVDAIRFEVPVQLLSDVVYEPFTIALEQKNDKVEMSLMWDNIKVMFPIQCTEPKP